MGQRLKCSAMLLTLLLVQVILISGTTSASGEFNEGSIRLDADPGDPTTSSPNRFPVHRVIPGEITTFTIWVQNFSPENQTVMLKLTDIPTGYLAYVTSSVEVPANGTMDAKVVVEVPDVLPYPGLDPNADHMIRVEGMGSPSGDKSFIILIIRIDSVLDHELMILPEFVPEKNMDVYPGQKLYFDLDLRNKGSMKDSYEIMIAEHRSEWEISFPEGEYVQYQLDHGKFGTDALIRVLVGVSPKAVVGSLLSVTIYSGSYGADLFDTGTRSGSVTVHFHVIQSSAVTIKARVPYLEVREGRDFLLDFDAINTGQESAVYTPRLTVLDGSPQMGWVSIFNPDTPQLIPANERMEFKVKVTPPLGANGFFSMVIGGMNVNGLVIDSETLVRIKPLTNMSIRSVEGGPFDKDEEVKLLLIVENSGYVSQMAMVEGSRIPSCYRLNITPSNFVIAAGMTQTVIISLELKENLQPASFQMDLELLTPSADDTSWVMVDSIIGDVLIRELPNIAILSLDIPNRILQEGESVPMNVTLANTGPIDVDNFMIVLYEVTFSNSRVEIGRMDAKLQSGEVSSFWFNWTARPSTRSISAVVLLFGVKEDSILDNELSEEIHVDSLKVPSEPVGMDGIRPGIMASGIALSIIFAGLAVVVVSSDTFRYSFFTMMIPLYSKLKPEHLLGNKLRRRIYVYVQNHPGEHFRSILVNLNLKNGTLAHHLYTLEKENLVRSHREGLYRRFYPAGFKIDESPMDLTPLQRKMLERIINMPGISQKELSEEMEISTSTVNYNIKAIKDKRLVYMKKDGKFTKLYSNDMDT
ncbi:MAG: winged helix-turn-helix transcriptional regulator [Candidatus Thermoplasmatota archaeon]|nr:winged helix-turn-helix transcriptional regulator [Candidatus Thermoplasmatota archaeon]